MPWEQGADREIVAARRDGAARRCGAAVRSGGGAGLIMKNVGGAVGGHNKGHGSHAAVPFIISCRPQARHEAGTGLSRVWILSGWQEGQEEGEDS